MRRPSKKRGSHIRDAEKQNLPHDSRQNCSLPWQLYLRLCYFGLFQQFRDTAFYHTKHGSQCDVQDGFFYYKNYLYQYLTDKKFELIPDRYTIVQNL